MTLKDELQRLLTDPQALQACYQALPQYEPHSIRARIYENLGKVFKRIAKGVYLATNGKEQALIIEGDAWERITDIEDNSIDFIITDSPYSTADRWVKTGTTRKRSNSMSFELRDMDQIMYHALHRVLKTGGHCFLFFSADTEHTVTYNDKQRLLAQGAGFVFNKRMIWDKVTIGMGYNGRNRYEQIFFLSKGHRHMPYDLGVPDVLSHKRPSHTTRRHESEKPVALIIDLLKMCARPGDIGLDPFAGSCNFIEACLKRGAHAIAIDKNPAFIKTAAERFNATLIPSDGEVSA